MEYAIRNYGPISVAIACPDDFYTMSEGETLLFIFNTNLVDVEQTFNVKVT